MEVSGAEEAPVVLSPEVIDLRLYFNVVGRIAEPSRSPTALNVHHRFECVYRVNNLVRELPDPNHAVLLHSHDSPV